MPQGRGGGVVLLIIPKSRFAWHRFSGLAVLLSTCCLHFLEMSPGQGEIRIIQPFPNPLPHSHLGIPLLPALRTTQQYSATFCLAGATPEMSKPTPNAIPFRMTDSATVIKSRQEALCFQVLEVLCRKVNWGQGTKEK